jgi:hypothetical protein
MDQGDLPLLGHDTDQKQCAMEWPTHSGNTASPTFSEKIRNPLNLLYLHLSNISDLILRQFKNTLSHCNTIYSLKPPWGQKNNSADYCYSSPAYQRRRRCY